MITTFDLFQSACAVVEEARAALVDATARADLIKALVAQKMLNPGGGKLLEMEMDIQLLRSTVELAESTLAKAKKNVDALCDLSIEHDVALKLGEISIHDLAVRKQDDAAGMARARIEEARAFSVEAMRRAKKVRIPVLRV